MKLLIKSVLFCFILSLATPQLTGQAQHLSAGYLPLIFEPNVGQAAAGVAFVAHGSYPILLGSDRTELVLPVARGDSNASPDPSLSTVTLRLKHSNKNARAVGLNLLPGKSNYYIGSNSKNWRIGVPQYSSVAFQAVYPGTDIVYYGKDGQLEYDLVLSPGADPSSIRFEAVGVKTSGLNKSGDLLLQAPQGRVELRRPVIYQKRPDDTLQPVSGEFVVHGNEVSLRIGDYQKDRQLIIDPVLSFSTLIGANNNTTVSGVAASKNGEMYITGTTFATNYPTVKAYQSKNNGTRNVFVTKLNASGDVILYSTYIGGNAFDSASGIAVDSGGNAYITGTADSSDFPTTPGAFMTTCPSFCNTGFVSKFLSDGSLAFSTYMGGSNAPSSSITVDGAGEAYIGGTITSNDLATTSGAFEPSCQSGYCAYVEKLNASGSALVYSTYFGADSSQVSPLTVGRGIAVDTEDSAYLVGSTTSVPTQNPIQASYVGTSFQPNAFIAKFSPDGSSLIYSTYLGGYSPYFFEEGGDFATSVAVDSSGNAHVAGTSSSCDFPLTIGALSTSCVMEEYDQKIFALVLNSAGSELLFSTFLASGNTASIATDEKGNSYVAGNTTSDQFPVLNPIESNSQQSSSTTFITELNLGGELEFSTYFGSTDGATSAGIALDGKGGIYVAGSGQGDFPLLNPIRSQTLQTTYDTIFASKIELAKRPQFSLAPRVSPVFALRNISSSPLTIDSIVPSSNFTMGGDCGSGLGPGTKCTLILEGADDQKPTGTVTITTNASKKPQVITLYKSPNGDGTVGPLVSLYPAVLQFPFQLIGTTSPPQTFTLQNTGNQAATITTISAEQPFSQTNNCPAALAPSTSCTISVTYTAATSDDYGTISIEFNGLNSISNYVYGYGVSSSIVLSTSSVQYGNQTAGAPGVARLVNVNNATSIPTTAPSISVSGPFAQSNTCTGVLAPNASCRTLVSFVPSGNQSANGTLTVTSYGPGGSQTAGLVGTSIAAGVLELSPVTLSFTGSVAIAQSSNVTVNNISQNPVPVTGISTAAPFSETNNCPSSLGPAATCQIVITYDPMQSGSSSGTLQVSYTGGGSPQTISLTGVAQTVVQFSPSAVQFGTQPVNTSGQTSAWVENDGGSTVALGNVTVQGSDFSIATNSCGSTLAGNRGCGIELAFKPKSTGPQNGSLSVSVNGSSTPITATLQGTGISSGVGSVSPGSLEFGSQAVGTESSPVNVTLSNTGTGALGLTSISVSPASFSQQSSCGSTLAPKASCTIAIRFSPTLQGMLVGSLTVQTDGAGSPQTASLSGIGQ